MSPEALEVALDALRIRQAGTEQRLESAQANLAEVEALRVRALEQLDEAQEALRAVETALDELGAMEGPETAPEGHQAPWAPIGADIDGAEWPAGA